MYKQRPNSQPSFSPEYFAAITYRMPFRNLYQRQLCRRTLGFRVVENEKTNSEYRFLNSKLLESIINKNVNDHHKRNYMLSAKQYEFRWDRSTADVIVVIKHRISEALDNKLITRASA